MRMRPLLGDMVCAKLLSFCDIRAVDSRSSGMSLGCENVARFYCFEQPLGG